MQVRGVVRRTTIAVGAAALLLVVLLGGPIAALGAEEIHGYTPDGIHSRSLVDPDTWVDPAVTHRIPEDRLVPVPYFNFATLHDSSVLAAGIDQLVVEDDPLPAAVERHLRTLQVRDTVATMVDDVAVRIRLIRRRIVELNDAIDHEHTEEARLLDEIDVLRRAIAEFAVRAFIGEEQLDTALGVPTTELSETRVLSDEVRESQFGEITAREVEHAERQAHRARLEDDRRDLRGQVRTLQEERIDLLASRRQLVDLAESTALSYQVTLHDRLPAMVEGLDIPLVAMNAYVIAERALAEERPECGIEWWMLAGIGRIESFHGHFGDSTLDIDGNSTSAIRGPALDGRILEGAEFLTATTPVPEPTDRTEDLVVDANPESAADPEGAEPVVEIKRLALIEDTDDGRLDGDAVYDRAVGPMQFIPQTWKRWEVDVNGDGTADPQNVYDAALASARYLCESSGSMRTEEGRERAFFAYNHDEAYTEAVAAAADRYRRSVDLPTRVLGTTLPLGIAGRTVGPVEDTIASAIRALDLTEVPDW